MMLSCIVLEQPFLPVLGSEILNKGASKRKLPEDDLRSSLHQAWKDYFNFCNGS